jgi:hypothetical protein
MHRLLIFSLASLCLLVWGSAALLLRDQFLTSVDVLPTLLLIPSPTASSMPTTTPLPTETPTPTATQTPLPVETQVSTPTPTLAVHVLEISASMLDTAPVRDGEGIPQPTAELPLPLDPLPDATRGAPPFMGWYRFESDHPNVQYVTGWTRHLDMHASRGQYHQGGADATARFVFEGEAVRLQYRVGSTAGSLLLVIDGIQVASLDTDAALSGFRPSPIYRLQPGGHWLEVRAQGDQPVGIDAIDIFRGSAAGPSLTVWTLTPSPTARVVTDIELISAPATIQPTGTPIPPQVLSAGVVIAYDENGNQEVDPAEGVAGISVRVVDTTTNQVIASQFTDPSGYAQFEMILEVPARIVVPYFGQSWDWRSERDGRASFVLLLTPGNQPGLIP